MEQEKKYVGGWFVWAVVLCVFGSIVLGGLHYFGMIGSTVVERVVFEQSYQKQEADKEAVTAYDAQLAQLRSRLNDQNLSNSARNSIKSQIDAIVILKAGKQN